MEDLIYGYLIVLGTNGRKNWKYSDNIRETNKLKVTQRKEPNGIKQIKGYKVSETKNSHAVKSDQIYTVSYKVSSSEAVVIEYGHDPETDMYQIGRCTEDQIDLVVNSVPPENRRHSRPLPQKSMTAETVSRYACRIMIDREPPHQARIYAAGFDHDRNIFLGENAIKWEDKINTVDGFTTNGVMIRQPDVDFDPEHRKEELICDENSTGSSYDDTLWREVSVSGSLYSCLSRRGVPQSKYKLPELNVLRDGTLIDLCGVTLIWRCRYADSEIEDHVQSICGQLNDTHIHCPVGYQTLRISPEYGNWCPDSRLLLAGAGAPGSGKQHSRSKASQSSYRQLLRESQPYVYMACGHVHGYHSWRANHDDENNRTCPLCKRRGPFVPLRLGQETGFFLDMELPSYCFNPCGHMTSEATVSYWCRVPLPNSKSTQFVPRCPFCYQECRETKPVRLFFLDNDE